MKSFLLGLWVLLVALGATYGAASLNGLRGSGAASAAKESLQLQKTRVINVPIIAQGSIRGFIVAQFAYTIDGQKLKSLAVSPDAFLLDEAFRAIYADDHLDFLHLEKYDVSGLTRRLVAATNRRLGMDLVHDVLIQDFTFVSKEDADR